MQAESSKFASLSFVHGFQIVIPPRSPASVPETIRTPSDGIDSIVVNYVNEKLVKGDSSAQSATDP